jgi:hypothetical protein
MIRQGLLCLSFALWTLYGLAETCPAELAPEKSAVFNRGLDHFYNTEYSAAVADFTAYAKLEPGDPRGYWRELLARYFLFKTQQRSDTPAVEVDQYENIVAIAATGAANAKTQIGKGSCIDFNRFVVASILGIRALFEFKNDPGKPTWLKANATITEAVAIAKKSKYQDAGFFLGTINYELGNQSVFQWFFGLGPPHNKAKGKVMIFESTAKNESPFIDDIWFFIFDIERRPGKRDAYAQDELKNIFFYLLKKYPRNTSLLEFQSSHKF